MIVYIDALFDGCGEPGSEKGPGFITTDSRMVYNRPPYELRLRRVMVQTSDLAAYEFLGTQKEILEKTFSWLRLAPAYTLAGWRLDRVLVPAMTVLSMLYGARGLPMAFKQRLNDKWPSSHGYSIERAFLQGWFPSKETEYPDLSLEQAAMMMGINVGETMQDSDSAEKDTLMNRLSLARGIFSTYQGMGA